ncbi:hypothetical protein MMPV_000251 [Pyropia vietnamensis]
MGKRPSRGMVTKTSLGSSARASAKRRSKQKGRGRIHSSAVLDPTIAAAWDNTLSVKANLTRLGLAADPNTAVGSASHRQLSTPSWRPPTVAARVTAKANRGKGGGGNIDSETDNDEDGDGDGAAAAPPDVMSLTLAALVARSARGEAPRPDHPAAGEVAVVRSLVAAYGTDYARMARDTKRNYQQHTPAVLKRMVERVAKADAAAAAKAAAAAAKSAAAAEAAREGGGAP